MLTELCAELRNWFVKCPLKDVHKGSFTVSGGHIQELPFLQQDQYFRIVGSVFNDGVWQYGDTEAVMHDEVFDGEIWAMSVPMDFIALNDEISNWIAENAQVLNSPYASESFGGYSYSLRTSAAAGDGGGNDFSWKTQFASKLARWRKL